MAATRRFCSLECKGIASRGQTTRPNVRVDRVCQQCGKVFVVKRVLVERGRGKFCSRECADAYKVGKPGHEAPHRRKQVTLTCLYCGKTFSVIPSLNVNGRRKFCSRTCKASHLATCLQAQQEPTSIEIAVEQVLIHLGEQYDPQKLMGPWRVDFYLPIRNLVIECDGDYWHSKPEAIKRDTKKNNWMKARGYAIVRLSETAIRANVLQCVAEGLAKHGIDVSAIQQLNLWEAS